MENMALTLKRKKIGSFAELRQSPLTKDWVLINPGRAKRPEEFDQIKKKRKEKKNHHECPFCHGNEAKFTEKSFLELYLPKEKNWAVRVIPNKYPVVLEEKVDLEPEKITAYHQRQAAVGSHEVLITADHQKQVADLSVSMVDKMLEAYQIRIQELTKNKDIKYVLVFQNHGDEAGASIVHPHSQLIALNHVPSHPVAELNNSQRYFQETKHCLNCDILALERKINERVVMESRNFAAYSPYASRFPFTVWIIPKKHLSNFEKMDASLRFELAGFLKKYLRVLNRKLGHPSYNYYLHTLPINGRYSDDFETYHWHLSIFPRLSIWAGFEFGSGIAINDMPPEKASHFLKN